MDMLRLAIIASSTTEKQNLTIKNAVTLAINCSDEVWALVESTKANLLLIWVNSDKDLQVLHGLQEKYPPERLVVLASNEYTIQAPWYLPFIKEQIVPAILSIANLFNRIQKHLLPDYRSGMPGYFDSNNYLVGIIENVLANNIACICSYPSCPEIYLLPNENSFYLHGSIDELIPMILACRRDITVVETSEGQIHETVKQPTFSSLLSDHPNVDYNVVSEHSTEKKYHRYTINELIWFALLCCSRGRLLKNTSLTETISLKQIPGYLRIDFFNKEYMALADHMSTRAQTMQEIASATPYSLPEIIGFVNACHALQLIERGDSAKQHAEKNDQAYKIIKKVFVPIGKTLSGRIKIVVAGSVGCGKTTTISTLSHFTLISTENRCNDSALQQKATALVTMDYGEIHLAENLKILLYGTPGQKQYDFMSQTLCDGAWGMLLLIDNTEIDPLAELDYHLQLFEKYLPTIQLAIAITHTDITEIPTYEDYMSHLNHRNIHVPVLAVDTSDIGSLTKLMIALVPQ